MSDKGEQELKYKFRNIAENDFEIIPNVNGHNLVHEKEVIIDFMLYPKPLLIESGFIKAWFGVEVKHFDDKDGTGKMSRFLWQCITYSQSAFQIKNQTERPAFVLGFSNIDRILDESRIDKNNLSEIELCRMDRSQWTGMVRISGLANVGIFHEVIPTRNRTLGGWKISSSSSYYFRYENGKYKKLNYNIFKENIGNCLK